MASLTNPPWATHRPLTPVGKIRTYVQLPAFSYDAVNWLGYSEIVTQFNFAASKNFYLKNRPAKPTGCNFLLCIKYRVGNDVFRYKLWTGVGEVTLDEIPLYNGQIIKKNFVLEVWSTGTEASLADAVNIITSVVQIPTDLSDLSDVAFAEGEEFNDFSAISGMDDVDLPADVGTGSTGYYHWKSSGIVNSGIDDCSQWTNEGSLQAAGDDLIPMGDNPQIIDAPEGLQAISARSIGGAVAAMLGNITNTRDFCMFVVFKLQNWTELKPGLILYQNGLANALMGLVCSPANEGPPYLRFESTDTVGVQTFTQSVGDVQNGVWGIACIRAETGFGAFSLENSPEVTIAPLPEEWNRLMLNPVGADGVMAIAEIVLYDGSGQTDGGDKIQQAWTHLVQRFGLGIQMPVTFNPDAAWLDNE